MSGVLHLSFVTTPPPRPSGGWGIAVEMSGALTNFCHGSAGEITGVCFMYAKKVVNEKIAGCWGKQQWFYQRAVPTGWGF